jgi:tRNA-2-methylthio-N6-dimethylallyladenosine synthase
MQSPLAGLFYFVKTFGCQMNMHDSERVSGLLSSQGCIEVSTPEEADIVVYMTCCVREKADTHLYGQVSAMVSAPPAPHGRRVVCIGGCIGQRDGATLKERIKNVDVVFGTQAINKLPGLIEEVLASHDAGVHVDTQELYQGFSSDLPSKREQRFHAWVPIMTGCNNFCSYCIVPHVRGREQSRVLEDVVAEVEALKKDGVREVTLLGQNVNSYGRDRYGAPRFAELLRAVAATGIERIRFTSSHPKDLSEETIAAMAELPAVMPSLHLAMQSGSTAVLKAMNRKYTREDYLALAKRIQAAVPGIALSTDIIVGFPTETESDFQDTLSIVREIGFASAFTFIYSKREGTPAARMENVATREEIQDRFDRLAELVAELAFETNQVELNTVQEVLVEAVSKRDSNVMQGRSRKNQVVHFELPTSRTPEEYLGKLVDVQVDTARTWYLKGCAVSEPR